MASSGTGAKPIFMPDDPWRREFLPLVWIGNDEMGLTWFAESDQHWTPGDEGMVEVLPGEKEVTLRLNVVRKPLTIRQPIRLTFGLMATPVRPLSKNDPFHVRMGYSEIPLGYSEFLQYPARGNVLPKLGTLEFYLLPTIPHHGPPKDVVSITHRLGIQRYGETVMQWVSGIPPAFQMTRTVDGKTVKVLYGPAPMEPRTWHHVALTWGTETRLYLDGKLVAASKESLGLDQLVGVANEARWIDGHPEHKLILGASGEVKRYSWFAYDELRASGSVRYSGDAFSVPGAPFRSDPDTLLLDHLDDSFRPDGQDAETNAETIAGTMGEKGGVPSLGCRFEDGRFGKAVYIEITPQRTPEKLVKDWGTDARTLWNWLEPGAGPAVKYGWPPYLFMESCDKDLRKKVQAWGKLGVRSVPYCAFYGIGAPTPLSEDFGPEWMRIPKATTPAPPPEGHHYLALCGRSGYADYLAAATEWVIDTYDVDGIYTDGNGLVFPCHNTHHGCGYVDTDATVRNTWPIFATREYFKRIHKIIHRKKPNGLFINHVSYNLFIPVQGFSDIYYTGEHEFYEDLVNNRVRWQGTQWGLFTLLLGASEHIYTPVHYTQALLHGVSVWPHGPYGRNDVQRKTVRLWKVHDAFDTKTSEWIPYHRAEKGLVAADSGQIKTSLYLHRGKDALLVIGNLSDSVVESSLRLDIQALGFEGMMLVAENALTLEALPVAHAQVKARVLPKSFRVVWVRGARC